MKTGGSTTNLLRHLRKKHPEEARKCLEGSKNSTLYKTMQAELKKALNQKKPEEDSPAESDKEEKSEPTPKKVKKADREQWNSVVDSLVKTGSEAEINMSLCLRKLALFCAVDLHPYMCVHEDGFQ
eukprot:scaffold417890_cov40-Prasinocladus_malaysianus.AAC.1